MASSQTMPWEYLLPGGPFIDPLFSDHAVLCVMGENGESRPWADPLLSADGLDDDTAEDSEDDLDDLDEFDDEEDEDEDIIADEEEEEEDEEEDEDWDDEFDEDNDELDEPDE